MAPIRRWIATSASKLSRRCTAAPDRKIISERASAPEADCAAPRRSQAAVARENIEQECPRLRRTLVVWGAQDTLAPLRTAKVLVLKLPRGSGWR